jgi:RNA polymerase sigma factor (sigma-70 family)
MTFEQIYHQDFPKAIRYVRQLHPELNDDDVNQIVTDSFIKLLERMQAGQSIQYHNAWLRHVICHRHAAFIRHQTRAKRGGGWQQSQRPISVEHADFAFIDNLDTIEVLIKQLVPTMRNLAELILIHELTCAEVAKRLGISLRTAERRISRLRKTIKTLVS